MKKIIAALTFGMLALTGAQAAEIRVLSAGAVEPGLHAFAALVKRELGHELKITFNTAPPDEFVAECARLGQACKVLQAGERWSSAALA